MTWKSVSGASAYVIYQKAGSGGYKKAATVEGTSYIAKGLKTGTTYGYYVQAAGQNGLAGRYSAKVSAKPALGKVTSVKATAGSKKVSLGWKKVTGASGYVVYRAAKKSGTYKAVKTITSAKTVKFVNKSLSKGKTYYYKVRAYRIVDKKKVYGPFSAVKAAKVK